MPEIITISSRRISGTGLILPAFNELKYRRYTLFADIIRKPLTPYLNRESEPPETYYGVISLTKDSYVLCTHKIQFDAQIWNFDADIVGQTLIAVKCQYLGILESFANLGTALGLTVISVDNTIGNYRNLPLQWDAIYIKCFADTAIQFTLKAIDYDVCAPGYKNPAIPPQPPEKPEPISPGIGTNISDPYPDDELTDPVEIDKNFVPPPTGNACQGYNVLVEYTNSQDGKTQIYKPYLGPIGRVRRVTGLYAVASAIEIECRGNFGGPCGNFRFILLEGGFPESEYRNPVILSISPM